MGNPFSIPCDPCVNKVFQCLDKRGGYIHNLKKNLDSLETTMKELKAKREDLIRRVTREEDRGLQRLEEIKVWLDGVDTIEKRVTGILNDKDVELQKLCLCGFCSKSLRSSYRYGKRVFEALTEVERHNSRVFNDVAEQPQTSEVQEKQLQPIIVGQEKMLDKAWKHLKEDKVGIMGMYGMGGVGKTTLLTQLNNKLSGERLGFDFVIWVVVSKELNVEKIQNEIAEKIGLDGEEWIKKDKIQKTDVIYNFLRKKKFVLFLDDIWEKVDLAEIGVPFPTPKNRCKVAFTTRSKDVCGKMGVEYPIEVECLAEKEAFDLFQKKVGQRTLGSDPEIPDLARKVARKCSGLPLALNVIGETMSSKRTVHEWLNAIVVLDKYATEFSGMEDRILPLLKYSYDDLKGEHLKPCLLYCALFPEDAEIFKDHLVDYWICEGIIDGSEGIEIAEYKGYEIISNLVGASLLMEKTNSVPTLEPNSVRMHDVVREMALWIASGLGAEKEAWIVRAGVRLRKMPKIENWKAVRRMSLMNNNINNLAGSPECLELTTLLMQQNSDLKDISSKFFKSMPKLVVLDLSHNRKISELPDGISELGFLQFLNLSHTYVQRLPMGLEKLIHLNLDRTPKLSSIAGISNLRNLRVLKAVDSGFSWDRGIVEELETLEHLEVANIGIARSTYLVQYLRSHRLANCTRYLQMKNITHLELSVIVSLPAAMDTLRYLNVWDCEITEIWIGSNPRNHCWFLSLSSVSIRNCGLLTELTFLMFAPNLKRLDVENAYQVEGENESGIVPFQKLSYLRLRNLPKLTSIYSRTLTFPRLKTVDVDHCPKLKTIPQVASDQN